MPLVKFKILKALLSLWHFKLIDKKFDETPLFLKKNSNVGTNNFKTPWVNVNLQLCRV